MASETSLQDPAEQTSVDRALEKGILKTSGGMDFFDDRSKGTPQLLTGNI